MKRLNRKRLNRLKSFTSEQKRAKLARGLSEVRWTCDLFRDKLSHKLFLTRKEVSRDLKRLSAFLSCLEDLALELFQERNETK